MNSIDGDGRADYVFINLDGKSMGGFRNGAVANLKPAYWTPMKGVIDDLPVLKFSGWRFVDLNGDKRDDRKLRNRRSCKIFLGGK